MIEARAKLGVVILILFCLFSPLVKNVHSEVLIPDLVNYEIQVLESGKLVIIDFWAEWCKPCKIMKPILERLVEFNQKYNRDKISWLNVNVDNKKWHKKFAPLRGLPVLLFLKDGEEIYRIIGQTTFLYLQDVINNIFKEEELKKRSEKKDKKVEGCNGGVCPVPPEYK